MVKQESGFYIDQLKCLNELRGVLEIGSLDRVRTQEDAREIQLHKKKKLIEVNFNWLHEDSHSHEAVVRAEDVLEGLQPCQDLQNIGISGYIGRKPPSWFNDTWLISLTSIVIYDVNMENLPPSLSKMPFLKELEIIGALFIEEMRWQSSSGAVLFPKLEKLRLKDMSTCKEWRIEEKADGKPVCVVLPKLKLNI